MLVKNKLLQRFEPNSHAMFQKRSAKSVTCFRAYRAAVIFALLALSACVNKLDKHSDTAETTPPQQPERIEQPIAQPEIKLDPKPSPRSEIEETDAQKPVLDKWITQFSDLRLDNHVHTALKNNPDLWASATDLKSAIEQVTITGSGLWPNLNASPERNRIDNDDDGITTEIRTVIGTVNISWEADIWGKLSRREDSAGASIQDQAELNSAAELSLAANVTRAWFNLITNKLQLELAEQRVKNFQKIAKLIEENYQRGERSALDVYLSRTDVQRNISALSDNKFDYIGSLRAFKTLLGESPGIAMEFEAVLPTLVEPIPAGLPAQLLARRPDVKASQLRYKGGIANAKANNRDRYPSIKFTGSIGDSRDQFNKLFENDKMVQRLVSNATGPLFQAGALRSQEQQAGLDAESAYASLVKTTLNAFEEVERTLSRESLLLEQQAAITEVVKLAQGDLDLALNRYQSGIESYTTLLESQRSLFESKTTEINIRNALLQNRIGIHLALGGDFTVETNGNESHALSGPVKTDAEKSTTETTETVQAERP